MLLWGASDSGRAISSIWLDRMARHADQETSASAHATGRSTRHVPRGAWPRGRGLRVRRKAVPRARFVFDRRTSHARKRPGTAPPRRRHTGTTIDTARRAGTSTRKSRHTTHMRHAPMCAYTNTQRRATCGEYSLPSPTSAAAHTVTHSRRGHTRPPARSHGYAIRHVVHSDHTADAI